MNSNQLIRAVEPSHDQVVRYPLFSLPPFLTFSQSFPSSTLILFNFFLIFQELNWYSPSGEVSSSIQVQQAPMKLPPIFKKQLYTLPFFLTYFYLFINFYSFPIGTRLALSLRRGIKFHSGATGTHKIAPNFQQATLHCVWFD